MATFDLQCHSTVSDGALEPAEVIGRAAAAGIELVALTDHDSVGGVDAALEAAATAGVRNVPAVELSTVEPQAEDLHLLGYALDHRSPELLAALEEFRADRNARGDRMAARLRDLGLALDEGPLRARAEAGLPVGRPHLAEAVLGAPANAGRLAEEGLSDVGDVIRAYLVDGAPAFLRRTTPSVAEAIAVVHAAGGVAVWAHPFWDIPEPERVLATLDRFRDDGLDGVEAFYATHDEQQTRLLAGYAAEHGLLSTGSADFHGPDHKLFSEFGAFELYGIEPSLGPIGVAA